jgi:phosphatidylglycerophosphatase A
MKGFFWFSKAIVTVGGIGYAPKAPGTCGSFAGLVLGWLLIPFGGNAIILAALCCLLLGGIAGALLDKQEALGDDPSWFVMDEVVGQLLVLAITPPHWLYYVLAFALFRLFDIKKPFPVSWADKHVPGVWGIMLDDILAGLYAVLFMGVVVWL